MSESKAIPDLDLPEELQGMLQGVRDLQRRLPELSRRLLELTGTGRSSDGLVTVVCDSRGSVRSVEVSPRKYADKGSEVLAADVVTAVTAAQHDVGRKVDEVTREDPTGALADSLKGEFKVPAVAEEALARLQSRLLSRGPAPRA
jgi:DNA-binding protein YbaB